MSEHNAEELIMHFFVGIGDMYRLTDMHEEQFEQALSAIADVVLGNMQECHDTWDVAVASLRASKAPHLSINEEGHCAQYQAFLPGGGQQEVVVLTFLLGDASSMAERGSKTDSIDHLIASERKQCEAILLP